MIKSILYSSIIFLLLLYFTIYLIFNKQGFIILLKVKLDLRKSHIYLKGFRKKRLIIEDKIKSLSS